MLWEIFERRGGYRLFVETLRMRAIPKPQPVTILHVTWTQAFPHCLAAVFSSSGLGQFKRFPAQSKIYLGKGRIVHS